MIDPWYLENLVCPIEHLPLEYRDGMLVSPSGRAYHVIEGIPVMLLEGVQQTIGVADESLKQARNTPSDQASDYIALETLGVSNEEKSQILRQIERGTSKIDPVVAYLVGATNGIAYKHLISNLDRYPIPELRLSSATGESFLDLGCNWGRWCIAAARKGYQTIGIDPSLGAILAARRVAQQQGLDIKYLVADARYLPFKANRFDKIFSYSVLQHLSKENVRIVIAQIARVLKNDGTSFIQMPNTLGIRSLYHQVKRGFRQPMDFEVRYWTLGELERTFSEIGDSSISVDCYFGLGLQKSDVSLMSPVAKLAIYISEALRGISAKLTLLQYVADSVYIESYRTGVR